MLSTTRLVVMNHGGDDDTGAVDAYRHLPHVINHGARILVLAPDRPAWSALRAAHLDALDPSLDWDQLLKFIPDCSGVNFDEFVTIAPVASWHAVSIEMREDAEGLSQSERLLVSRAFPKAEALTLWEIPKGFSGSRVFMAYEKRKEASTSIAHWTQPRLIKVGARAAIAQEILAMQAVSPFIPFDLRPNLDTHVVGFSHSVFVADFVDGSESMLDAVHAGRGEAALSNLFNRTMNRWRERGWQRATSSESLADAAERLRIVDPSLIRPAYTQCDQAEQAGIDVSGLWIKLRDIRFPHRVATIHGDLHGDNVRVRGDDAILIDLGSVKGDDRDGGGAPLSFDIAMLEVALVFTRARHETDRSFGQAAWAKEIEPYYRSEAIGKALEATDAPHNGGWMLGCLQRIRAFGIYEQSDGDEYALALAIAMLRMCKFEPQSEADKGRRVRGLLIASRIVEDIHRGRMT
ncbi:MAG: hypothetical protein AAGC76_05415 [Luteibacter sp.]|uniref:hypothetical protein n=1 Tax=Luteibacter sp. TaxID=1886636 RepID=UPI0028077A36|nr:hypothetical protein [Luteibacter sp.]MDQ7995276.1 hypothetical protein [Luteibacter sp.]